MRYLVCGRYIRSYHVIYLYGMIYGIDLGSSNCYQVESYFKDLNLTVLLMMLLSAGAKKRA